MVDAMSEMECSEFWNRLEINLDSLRFNFRSIKAAVGPGVQIMAVVKADAYGHGMIETARSLAREGVSVFGVAETGEGVSLRQAGVDGDIVILLGGMAGNFADIITHDLVPVVYDRDNLKALSEVAENAKKKVRVHLKIDTGMGRLGIMPDEISDYLDLFEKSTGVVLAGVLSHFPMADSVDPGKTDSQCREFAALMAYVKSRAGEKVFHIANSAAIIGNSESHMSMVRPGITLYGCCPSPTDKFCSRLSLRAVMSFKSVVLQVKDIPAGSGISYGHVFITGRKTRLAVIPVGYSNGYLRGVSGRAKVLIHGVKVPVLGRVCMNACMVDVTDLGAVQAGDEVVLLGEQGNECITADEIAAWMDTISYEVLCLFGARNSRVYIANNYQWNNQE